MKVKLDDLLRAKPGIEEALQQKPSPGGQVSMPMARNFRLCQAAMSDFAKVRENLKAEYGEDMEGFNKALDELVEAEVDIDIHPIPTARIQEAEKNHPGFAYSDLVYYSCYFMFNLEDEWIVEVKNDEPTTEPRV